MKIDTNSIAHTTWNCKYDVILAIPRCVCYTISVNFHN